MLAALGIMIMDATSVSDLGMMIGSADHRCNSSALSDRLRKDLSGERVHGMRKRATDCLASESPS